MEPVGPDIMDAAQGLWSRISLFFEIMILPQRLNQLAAIIGLVLSVIAYAAVNAVLVRHVIRTGLSVSLFSRILLGQTGAAVATLIFFATAIYYAVFEGSVIALALQSYAGIAYPVAALIVVVYSVLLIFGSIQAYRISTTRLNRMVSAPTRMVMPIITA